MMQDHHKDKASTTESVGNKEGRMEHKKERMMEHKEKVNSDAAKTE